MRTSLTPTLFRAGLAGMIALAAAGVSAQGVPANEREPNPAAVGAAERAAGNAPSAATERRDAEVTNRLYRELTGQNPNAPTSASPPPVYQSPSQDAREENRLYRDLTGQSPNAAPR